MVLVVATRPEGEEGSDQRKKKTHDDMDMPFGYPRISIPGLTHYGGGLAQGLEDRLGDKERQL
jgi:hypothetical protein